MDAEVLLMKLQHEKSNMEWEMLMSERTIEINRAAEEKIKTIESRLETEKEEMMDAMALEVDEIEKTKDQERLKLIEEKKALEAEVAQSSNLTKALGKKLNSIANKSRNLLRFQRELNEKTIRDLNEMRKNMQVNFSYAVLDKLRGLAEELAISELR